MNEEWKNIEGYEGLYQVSNLGRVKSLNYRQTGREQILKTRKNNCGYLFVSLYINNKERKFTVHRLVANVFIPNPNNYPCVNHKDEDTLNNNVTNLEHCTYKYNNNYGAHNQRMAESKSIPIYCLENNKFYKSAKQAGKELDLDSGNITKVLKGKCKQTKGYTFRYANQVLFKGVK